MRLRQRLMGAALVAGLGAGTAWAQDAQQSTQQGAESAGQEVGRGAQRAGEAVEHGAERTGEAVQRGAERAEETVTGREQERMGKKMGKAQEEKQSALSDIALYDQEQIALGKLAQQRSDNPAVKQLASQLVQSHQQNLDSLQDYARGEDLEVAIIDLSQAGTAVGGGGMTGSEREILGEEKGIQKEARKLGKKEQARVDRFIEERDKLASKSGRDFDRAFIDKVKDNHEKQADAVKDAQKKYRDDAVLSQALSNAQPMLQQNEQQVRQVERQMRKEG